MAVLHASVMIFRLKGKSVFRALEGHFRRFKNHSVSGERNYTPQNNRHLEMGFI
jgi:hypothetical protein